jgi:N-acetylglucosamine kinase-like BadF-type ATPase
LWYINRNLYLNLQITKSLFSMKLIAETGSTRTEWALTEGRQLINSLFTDGINPFFQTRREISRSVRLGLPEEFFKKKLEQVYYYGAGCSSEEKKKIIRASLVAQFKTPVQVESDLLAAARGLFLREAGIACILGTGSNSCFYDGATILKNVRSGGYILGDEGSGAAMGRVFMSDVLKGIAPAELTEDFFDKFRITSDDIMDLVYNRPFPNRFLATVAYFLADHQESDYACQVIRDNLQKFFARNICQYDYSNYSIRFVGSWAHHCADYLYDVAQEFGVMIDMIEETPMKGLIEFHATEPAE